MKKINYIIIGLLFASFLVACNNEKVVHPSKQELIDMRIEKQLANWEKSLKKKCKRQVMEAAEAIVDSTLIAEARLNKNTSLKPEKPVKPDVPPILEIKDTLAVQPILE